MEGGVKEGMGLLNAAAAVISGLVGWRWNDLSRPFFLSFFLSSLVACDILWRFVSGGGSSGNSRGGGIRFNNQLLTPHAPLSVFRCTCAAAAEEEEED